ncbi:cobalt transporter CbiM [Otariodibacter sp.]|uniref:cobalt transporter CbiM n=1 Tax=Otariodibacter sp. TaxID=3030919 RepID=UPI0026290606|nr:cobalt transporter CbiM [Otariodibacter sp.]
MHLSEGVLHIPTLACGVAVAVIGVIIGLKKIDYQQLPLTALFSATFFVASTIHVPIGIGSVHLILNGIAGIFLGWAVFPAFLIALVLQAFLFSFGGLTVLGINLCIMALPAVLVHYLFNYFRPSSLSSKTCIIFGIMAGVIGIAGSALLASLVLMLDGGADYSDLITLLLISHTPVLFIDSAIGATVLILLLKMYPSALKITK